MLVALQFITYLACAIFAGAALYVTLVEHPARMQCETRIAATQWAPSYCWNAGDDCTLCGRCSG